MLFTKCDPPPRHRVAPEDPVARRAAHDLALARTLPRNPAVIGPGFQVVRTQLKHSARAHAASTSSPLSMVPAKSTGTGNPGETEPSLKWRVIRSVSEPA